MTAGFVPIASATPGKPGAAMPPAPLSKPAHSPGPMSGPVFRPVTQAVIHTGQTGSAGEPKVTLERDGDRITKIKVQCPCGHVVELSCVY